ncbi:MAG: hypothetical protein SFT90_06065 [Rickettsiales bacterium]|nr:hypothetical protein [Rickettsiales bacterium]
MLEDKNKIQGFSLLELTAVIIIISFIVSTIVFTTQARLDASRIYVTKERMQTIMDSIDRYVENYGHIPCPANPSVSRVNANYGWGTGTNATVANCPQASTFFASGSGTYGDIVVGMVPFKTLVPPLDPSIAVDGWGNRFSFFVTERYTNRSNYKLATGVGANYNISNLPDGTGTNYIDTTNGDVAYILLSHGPNGDYAYRDKDGTQLSLATHLTSDTENGVAGDAQFVCAMPNALNDDILVYKNKWQLPNFIND